MSKLTTPCDVASMSARVFDCGQDAGTPAVYIEIGEANGNQLVKSIKRQMEAYKWISKLRTGRTMLVVTGESRDNKRPVDPFWPKYEDGLHDLLQVVRPKRAVALTRGQTEPSAEIDGLIDAYKLRISRQQLQKYSDGKREVWHWFSDQARYYDNVEFLPEMRTLPDSEKIEVLQKNYKIPYQSMSVLLNLGDIDDPAKRYNKLENVIRQNEWRLAPDIRHMYENYVRQSGRSD